MSRRRYVRFLEKCLFLVTGFTFGWWFANFLFEFPRGPVELGEQFPVEPAEELVVGRKLKILSPTDCVKDRLADFIHWGTRDLFDQAVLVCRRQAERIHWRESLGGRGEEGKML